MKKEFINHLEVVEDQKEEDMATIKIQMKRGMINQISNATIVINLAIILGNVIAQILLLTLKEEENGASGSWYLDNGAITCVVIKKNLLC